MRRITVQPAAERMGLMVVFGLPLAKKKPPGWEALAHTVCAYLRPDSPNRWAREHLLPNNQELGQQGED